MYKAYEFGTHNVCYELLAFSDSSILFTFFHPETTILKHICIKQVALIIESANKLTSCRQVTLKGGTIFVCLVDLSAQ